MPIFGKLRVNASDIVGTLPYITVNATSSQPIAADVQRVYTTGNITINLEDRASSGVPVTIRSKSGTATITADLGTLEFTTVTAGQSRTFAFDPIDEVWYQV